MHKYTTILIALFLTTSMFAQEDEKADTTTIKLGDLNVQIYEEPWDSTDKKSDTSWDSKAELTHWAGFELGMNMLVDADGSLDLGEENNWLDQDYARSFSYNINLMEFKARLVKDYVGIVTGLGFTFNNYGLKDNVEVGTRWETFTPDSSEMIMVDSTYGYYNDVISYTKNKLRASYLKVPVLLEFNTSDNAKRSFHLAAGVIGGWRMSSSIKQKYQQDGENFKQRRKSDLNMRDWTLDATVRVGYGDLTLFATYGLTSLFEDGQGPEIYPVTVGVSLIPF